MTREEIKKIYRNGPTADEMGEFYSRHAMAMTAEQLYSKSEIAMELGFRDMRIEELLAAVKQLREEHQWQPIETAPRDGAEILLYYKYQGCTVGRMSLTGEYWLKDCSFLGNPTHWIPLPAVPQDFINDRIEKGRR